MSRFVKGVTLTQKERHMARGLQATNGQGAAVTPNGIIKSHTCMVRMPDGSDCTVEYIRYSSSYHSFSFSAPFHQRFGLTRQLTGGMPAIESAAAELAEQAFRQAQAEEQKRMRRKTPPMGSKRQPVGEPTMDAKMATRCAGLYAVCVQLASGNLLRIGPAYERPEVAQQELRILPPLAEPTNGQIRVIGICNRLECRWVEAQFLAVLLSPLPEPEPVDCDLAEESEEADWDTEEESNEEAVE